MLYIMNVPLPNSQIIREITPLSDKDCFYIAERYKTEFTYPIHNHPEKIWNTFGSRMIVIPGRYGR